MSTQHMPSTGPGIRGGERAQGRRLLSAFTWNTAYCWGQTWLGNYDVR